MKVNSLAVVPRCSVSQTSAILLCDELQNNFDAHNLIEDTTAVVFLYFSVIQLKY